jgi:hypothetical protein
MSTAPTATISDAIASRVHELDWPALTAELHEHGFAITNRIYTPQESRDLADLFDGDGFRSTIDMARHRFGDGRYRYFDHPLPDAIQGARTAFYEQLAPIANAWGERLSGDHPTFPTRMRSSWSAAARPARNARPRSCCATTRATGTPCTRTSTATSTSRFRSSPSHRVGYVTG